MKKILALILAALLMFCMVACSKGDESKETYNVDPGAEAKNTFTYGINDEGDYEITGYVRAKSEAVDYIDLEFPTETPEGREIVGIAKDAFKATSYIKSVKIPESYQYIGAYAFADCDALKTVTLPDTMSSIGQGAFQDCGALESVNIPSAVTEIESYTFYLCSSLKSVTIHENVTYIGILAFSGCDAITDVVIPEGVTTVEMGAFMKCKALKSASVPASVTMIGQSIFYQCPEITVKVIKDSAFHIYTQNPESAISYNIDVVEAPAAE